MKPLSVFPLFAVVLALLAAAPTIAAAQEMSTQRILGGRDQTTQTVTGVLHGFQKRNFVIAARPGQRVDVRLTSDNRYLYFNLNGPSGDTMFDGSSAGGVYSGQVRRGGDHTVQLYLTADEARRGGRANFRLVVTVSDHGGPPGRPEPRPPFPGGPGAGIDCFRPSNPAERAVCNDSDLIALDRSLAGVFRQALSRAGGGQGGGLIADQRGWTDQRNACAANRRCLRDAYQNRIAFLQARWGLVSGRGPTNFFCTNGRRITATFFQTNPGTVVLVSNGQTSVAFQAQSADGARYTAPGGVSFWNRGAMAMVDWPPARGLSCFGR
jgi:uncharacterized protein